MMNETSTLGAATLRPIDIEKLAYQAGLRQDTYEANEIVITTLCKTYAAKVLEDKEHEIARMDKQIIEMQAYEISMQNRANDDAKEITELEVKLEEKERELNELKAELSEQLEIKKQMQSGVVQVVDAIAEYFGKRNPYIVKLLEQVKELR